MRKIKTQKINKKKQIKKLQEEIKSKIVMFDRLPEECSVCKKEFIKNKKNVDTWKVQVYNETKKVLLYCPDCNKIVEEGSKKLIEQKEKGKNK